MTIFKKISISILSIGIISFFSAQKADSQSQSVLDAVTKNYKSNKNTYFKFAYSTGANGKTSKTQTGIFYTTPSQYKLKIMGIEQIFDGNKVYNISAEDQEITIAKTTGNDMMFSPTNYLDSYKKDYNTKYIGKKLVNGKNTDHIQLTPIKSNGIKKVNLYVDSTKKQMVKIEQISNTNDIATISVVDYKVNQNLSADLFKFNKNQYSNFIITEL